MNRSIDHLAFWCKDVRRGFEKVLAGGATSALKPWDEDSYALAFVKDPDGVMIGLIGEKVNIASRRQNGKF